MELEKWQRLAPPPSVRRSNQNDIKSIQKWARLHSGQDLRAGALSTHGYISPGVACGFLYTTNSDLATIDSYISNPFAPAKEVYAALEIITARLIRDAEKLGVKQIFCNSTIRSIKKMAIRNEFSLVHKADFFVKTISQR